MDIEKLSNYEFLKLVQSEAERRNDRDFAMFSDGGVEKALLTLDLIMHVIDI